MICKRCYRMSDDGLEYCPYCGKSFTDDSEIEIKDENEVEIGSEADIVNEAASDTNTSNSQSEAESTSPLLRRDSVPQGNRIIYDYTMPPPRVTPPPFVDPVEQEKSPVRKFFSAVGHAALYFILFFVCSTIVSNIYCTPISFGIYADLTEKYTAEYGDLNSLPIEMRNEIYDRMKVEHNERLMEEVDQNALSAVAALVTVVAILLIAAAKKRPISEHIGFYPPHSWKILLLIPAGISLQFIVTMVIQVIPWSDKMVEDFTNLYSYVDNSPFWLEVLATVVCAPIVEELVFRGCVYTRLRRGMPAMIAVVISACLFGAAHGVFIAFTYATLLGLILAYVFDKFGTVIAAILFHASFNAANYVFAPILTEDADPRMLVLTLAGCAVIFTLCAFIIMFSEVGRRKSDIPASHDIPPIQ